MKIFIYIIIQFLLLVSCGADKKVSVDKVHTPPTIVEYNGESTVESKAIERIKNYLVKKDPEVSIDEFFVDKIEKKGDTVVVHVHHYNYYVELAKVNREFDRTKILEERGDSAVGRVYIPPTGNWSGKDRTIFYLIEKDSLIDMLYQ